MKKYFSLILLLSILQFQAQDYRFGKVSKQELEKTVSDIDANANAEILYKSELIHYVFNQEKGFVQKKEVFFRIKIYNKEGLNWANHSLRLYNKNASDRTKLYGEKGYTYNLVGGKIEKTKLKNEGIFEEDVNEYVRKTSFALPNVKEGSIIELTYELETPFIDIEDIYVQELIPIKKLEVTVRIPEYFNFKKLVNPKSAFYPKLLESKQNRKEIIRGGKESFTSQAMRGMSGGGRRTYSDSELSFIENITNVNLENVPPLKEENYVDNLQNYVAKIVWEYSYYKSPSGQVTDYTSDWEKVSKTIYQNQNFGDQLKKTGYFEEDLNVLLSGVNDPMEKAALIFQFVKSKVKWNDYYGKFTINGVRKAYKEGTGNVADINLMLTAMLRYAGLNANPVLVSTKSHGIPITATLDGFNYVISAIEVQNDVILLDATDFFALPNILPKRAINWQGRLIRNSGSSTWISLQQREPVLDSKLLNFEIKSDLTIEGKVREHKTLQLAQSERLRESKLSNEERIEKLEDKDFEITVSNLEIKNDNDYSKPYQKSFDFESDELIEEIGDKIYISPLLFYVIEESPFKEESRSYPIDFVYPFSDKYMVNILMPEGYEVEYLPESVAKKLSEDDISSYKYIAKQNGNYIQLIIQFDYNYSFVPSNNYVAFRQYFNSYLEKLSDKIVLKSI